MGLLARVLGRAGGPVRRRRPAYRNWAVVQRLAHAHGLAPAAADAHFEELVVFLDLCADTRSALAPPPAVERAWEAFRAHPKAYAGYCERRLGSVITPRATAPAAYALAHRLRELSGYGPMDPSIWPQPAEQPDDVAPATWYDDTRRRPPRPVSAQIGGMELGLAELAAGADSDPRF